MLGAELIQGCGGFTKVPEVDGNEETKGEDRQSRNKLLEVIRAPFLRLQITIGKPQESLGMSLQCK